MRAIVLIPWAIPTVVSAKMWNWMLHDQFGVINDMLLRLGPDRRAHRLDGQSRHGALDRRHGRRVEDDALHGAADPRGPADAAGRHLRGGAGRRRASRARVLPGDAAADPAGPARRDHLPRPRCAARLRPDLRADRQFPRHHVDVGLCAPAARGFPGGRLRLGRLDADFPHHRASRRHHLVVGRVRLGGGGAR